jgi:hypothetical protein
MAEIAILKYIVAHQDARDTLEGIEKWWLPQTRPYSVADVSAALHALERRDLIQVWGKGSADPVYGRGSMEPQRIEDYLRSLE